MRQVIGRFSRDLDRVVVRVRGRPCPFSKLSVREMHRVVKDIPYKKDTAPVEVVARPARLLNGEFYSGLDCKKKSILVGAWAVKNNVPYRLIASSRRPDKKYHHVFPQLFLHGSWFNMDATYSYMRPGAVKRGTAFEVLQ